eukprot:6868991-Prymnesium_polylepis.1
MAAVSRDAAAREAALEAQVAAFEARCAAPAPAALPAPRRSRPRPLPSLVRTTHSSPVGLEWLPPSSL